ncbi:MAG: hypothetical protein ACTSRS_00760 [Candidatus Helarchaeota archaeon]
MSSPPSGGNFLPFMTSVTTDIYDRIEKLSQSLTKVQETLQQLVMNIGQNLDKITENIKEMIEQGEMNKEMTLEAFADTMNTLVQQIKTIRNETIQGLKSTQTEGMIKAVSDTANLLESRMYDIQIAFLINGIHALINAIKAGRVVGIPTPIYAKTSAIPSPAGAKAADKPLGAPIPTLADDSAVQKKKSFYGKGVRKKTHDEIMEEKRKKDAMFRKYLK